MCSEDLGHPLTHAWHDVVGVGTVIRIADGGDILILATPDERVLVTHDRDFADHVFLKSVIVHGMALSCSAMSRRTRRG